MIKIAFFGTPAFAAKILDGIMGYSNISCCLVVSQPDKPMGRKQEIQKTPVKITAEDYCIDVLQPNTIQKNRDIADCLSLLELDFIVVVAYGKIIPKMLLDIPKYGCINIHGSILPYYRGASPVQAAIRDGNTETGLTIMYMSEGMDEGNILKIEKILIDNNDKSHDIFQKMITIAPGLLYNTLQEIVGGKIHGTQQNHQKATYCGKVSRVDGAVYFTQQSAQDIYNMFRAYDPWPGVYTIFQSKRMIIEKCCFDPSLLPVVGEKYGQCIKISNHCYGIVCADGKILEISQVKIEGKRSMSFESFINGRKKQGANIFV